MLESQGAHPVRCRSRTTARRTKSKESMAVRPRPRPRRDDGRRREAEFLAALL